MPIPPFADAKAQQDELDKIERDLATVWDHFNITALDKAHLARLGLHGLHRVANFFEDERAKMIAVFKDLGYDAEETGLNPQDKMSMKVRIADLSAAFREAAIQTKRQMEIRAEDRISDLTPKSMKQSDHNDLRKAYESRYQKLAKDSHSGIQKTPGSGPTLPGHRRGTERRLQVFP